MAITASQLRKYANLPRENVVPDGDLQVYLDFAALIISEDLSGLSLSNDRLEMIELNIAAHFAIQTYEFGGLVSQVVGESQERYQVLSDKNTGLASTRFGQSAISLDTSDTLAKMATTPIKARFQVL